MFNESSDKWKNTDSHLPVLIYFQSHFSIDEEAEASKGLENFFCLSLKMSTSAVTVSYKRRVNPTFIPLSCGHIKLCADLAL